MTSCLLQHKLLRQKRWHVPVPAQALNPLASQPLLPKFSSALSLHPPLPSPSRGTTRQDQSTAGDSSTTAADLAQPQIAPIHVESALDIEFDNAWETTSDWNEDDEDAADEENLLCFGSPQLQQQMEEDPTPHLADGGKQEGAATQSSDTRQDHVRDFTLPPMNGREDSYLSVPPRHPAAHPLTLEASMAAPYSRSGPSRGNYPPRGPGRGIGTGTGPGGYHPPTGEQQTSHAHTFNYAYSERPLGHRWTRGPVNQYQHQQQHQHQHQHQPSGPRVWPPPSAPQSMTYDQQPPASYYQNGPSALQGGYYGGSGGGGYPMNGR